MKEMTPEQKEFVRLIDEGLPYKEALVASGCDEPSAGAYYVYALVDPRSGHAFYIGKGTGNRVKHHARNARRGKVDNAEKHKRITEILDSGNNVQEEIFQRFDTETEAVQLERSLIRALCKCGLTNISMGVMSNAEKEMEEIKALQKNLAPRWWLVQNPDRDFVKVFGSMEKFCDWRDVVMAGLFRDAQMKLDGTYVNPYS